MNCNKLLLILGVLTLIGCSNEPTFEVSGIIKGAQEQMIYLEHSSLTKTQIVDSCEIDEDGTYSLEASAPKFPDFYSIRIGNRSLTLAVDSTEQIQVSCALNDLPNTLNIIGSQASLEIAKMRSAARTSSRDDMRTLTQDIIIANPASLAAYYAVYLKQDGKAIWDMSDYKDRRMYQAVATSFELKMPEYYRTKALRTQVLESLEQERNQRTQLAMQELVEESENTFLDITLPDDEGDMRSLSDLRGNVIILDFSSIQIEQYAAYNLELRELYNKYQKEGLSIYSVAVDSYQFAWEDMVKELPWTTVRTDNNTASSVLMTYNVQALPTLYLLDREGNVQGRYTDFQSLETDIKKYL